MTTAAMIFIMLVYTFDFRLIERYMDYVMKNIKGVFIQWQQKIFTAIHRRCSALKT